MYNQIYNLLKRSRIIIEEHSFLTFANFLSLFLGLVPFFYILLVCEINNKLEGFKFLVPFIFVYLSSLISYFICKKSKIISCLFSILVNSFIIIVIQIIAAFFICAFILDCDIEEKCNKIENYQLALKRISEQDKIKHFPVKIPNNATNIILKTETLSFFGSEDIYLKFDTNKEFINNELKKYSYIKIIPFDKFKQEYCFYFDNAELENFIFYVIGDKAHENPTKHEFPYFYGIGVNKKHNKILYYYESPD